MKQEYKIFILSYGRADKVYTYKTLLQGGIAKKDIYIVCSDDDKELSEYQKLYDNVIIFSKEKARKYTDLMDNFEKRNIVVFARNAIFEIVKRLNIGYFIVLDDDYDRFIFRRCFSNQLKEFKVKFIKPIFEKCIAYLKNTTLLNCFCLSQNGDFIGGVNSFDKINFKRKIMNVYFFRANTPIKFLGSLNEDLTASVYEGQRGKLMFTINDVAIHQKITQSNGGGLTEAYLDSGTYVKSFYSVIAAPNCVKISAMGSKDLRIHHKVDWNKAVPKLLRAEYE